MYKKIVMKKRIIAIVTATVLAMSAAAPASANSTTSSIGLGYNHGGFVAEGGQLMMRGRNVYGEFGNGIADITNHASEFTATATGVLSVVCGTYYSTAILKSDNTLWTSGRNNSGQLGNDTTTDSTTFIKLDDNVVKVGAGSENFVYLKSDGTLWGVGNTSDRSLLINQGIDIKKPVKILSGVKDFSTGLRNTAVIMENNDLYTFGSNVQGQLGVGNTDGCFNMDLPCKVLSNVRMVSCGTDYMMAVTYDNVLYTWGKNDYAQLMNGHDSYENGYIPVYSPTKVADNVLKCCAGNAESAYITTDNKLFMTGHNLYDELGFLSNNQTVKQPKLISENVADVATSTGRVVYTTLDGKAFISGPIYVDGLSQAYVGFREIEFKIASSYDFSSKMNIKEEVPGQNAEQKPGQSTESEQKISISFKSEKVALKKGGKKTLKLSLKGAKKAKFTVNGKGKKIVKLSKVKAKSVVVIGKKKGKAKVTAKVNGKKAVCTVIVK